MHALPAETLATHRQRGCDMKTLATFLPKPSESEFHAETVIKALSELQPKKALVVEIFTEIFPALREAVRRGVPRKAILRELDVNGVKLNAASFKKLYDDEERKQLDIGKGSAS